MTDETLRRGYQLLKEASDLPPGKRERFLAERASSEGEAAAVASRMLRDFELSGAIALPEPVAFGEPLDREGTQVDKWHIEEFLGDGGFGRVYKASQSVDGQKEVVAIKFLDMLPNQVARFMRERQTLADLSHEGICKFIDGGTTKGGTPYIAMEFVVGLPITTHCNKNSLSITERLRLFVQVCRAVEYAHQQGVLHRDLKPVNILVTAGGAIRIIDFGVAQLLDPARNPQRLTKFGESPWTKAYASPEQVEGKELSLATDVYSLGVVLYELLTGQRPFSDLALSGPDWKQVICEQEPLPPSQAVLIQGPHGEEENIPEIVASQRGTTPSRLRRKLAGNLDAVVLNAVRKGDHQRYSRVERLRSDLELLLEGLPASVRRCGIWERVRNRSAKCPVTAALIVASILSVVYPFTRGFPGQIEDQISLYDQQQAVWRLQHLAEISLPRIEDSLPPDPATRDLRLLTARIHTRLLQSGELLSDHALRDVDDSLAVSALRCANEWRSLGDTAAALAATAPILPRAARRFALDHLDNRRRDLYAQILRQRIELHSAINQHDEASDEIRLLDDVNRSRR